MTILSTVCTKLLCTNAHLGRRVAAHHLKVYIRCFRNGIAILDSDKTLICLRNALDFVGYLICQKSRSFFLKTKNLFIYSIMAKMWSCINDSQWKIGAFFTNSYANPKKFRSRNNKIYFGLNRQPDCVVILHPDRKSSVILEADRSQIPIAYLVDSTIPSHKRFTFTIPANDPLRLLVYLFRNSITKTVRQKRTAINGPRAGARGASTLLGIRTYSAASPKWKKKFFRFKNGIVMNRKFCLMLLLPASCWLQWYFCFFDLAELFLALRKALIGALVMWLCFLFQLLWEQSATLGMTQGESWGSSDKLPSKVGGQKPLLMEAGEGSTQEGRKGKAPLDFEFEMEVRSAPDFIDPPLSPTEGERLSPTTGPSPEGGDHPHDNTPPVAVEPAPLPETNPTRGEGSLKRHPHPYVEDMDQKLEDCRKKRKAQEWGDLISGIETKEKKRGIESQIIEENHRFYSMCCEHFRQRMPLMILQKESDREDNKREKLFSTILRSQGKEHSLENLLQLREDLRDPAACEALRPIFRELSNKL
uniref:Ribosomal protein S2 n=1 Tax=Zea mays subsp. mays TaxID=381124 RepID=Q195L3_MAIZE|nr:ribosomal protein S2 [Zea mays subsp. mays]